MIRQTSIETFKKIKEEGLLGRKQFAVYEILYHHGPLTQKEVWQRFMYQDQIRTITPRFSELERRGSIQIVGTKIDEDSNKPAHLWDVTARIPVNFDKPKKHRCKNCDGRGYFIEQQAVFNLDERTELNS
jgi:hypothetical protein